MTQATRPALLEWMRANLDGYAQGMKYREAALEQMCFFRDRIATLFRDHDAPLEDREMFCKIEGWHTSKSIKLPVYYIATPAIEIIARDNFYNWNVTVRSTKSIDLPTYFDIDSDGGYLFMEGMENHREKLYKFDLQKFTFAVWGKYELFAIMWCIASQVKPS